MSGIVGSRLNNRGSGIVGSLGTDGQVLTSAGAGQEIVFEDAAAGGISHDGSTADGVLTFKDSDEATVEANLTFDGSVLAAAGNVTATGTMEPAGDTAANDNAAIGYTSAEGLILTGQGSTSDITLKNDADGTVFTVPTGTDDILFPDNAKAIWGAGSDLSIYHDGSDSFISDTGTGNLTLICGNLSVMDSTNSEDLLKADTGGAVELYYDNAKKLETTSTGITVTGIDLVDDAKIRLGTSQDLEIYHDGSDSYIVDTGTGNLSLRCGDFACKNVVGDEVLFKADQNGAFKAYYDNALKAETVTGGWDVTGAITKDSGSFRIKHPLPSKKDTHHLVHSFIEGPKADLIYRGKVTLSSGTATVNIDTVSGMTDGTFVVLCDDIQCFTTNESDWDAVKGSMSGNTLTINCENASSTATVSWMVIGDRKDEHMLDPGTGWTDGSGKPIIEPLQPEPEEE